MREKKLLIYILSRDFEDFEDLSRFRVLARFGIPNRNNKKVSRMCQKARCGKQTICNKLAAYRRRRVKGAVSLSACDPMVVDRIGDMNLRQNVWE